MSADSTVPLPPLRPRRAGPLRTDGGYVGRHGPYLLDQPLCTAANTAHLLGRPLLLTGEPGCGKTEFAWVVAQALGFRPPDAPAPEPLQCYVRSETRSRDLLYHYDALLRFTDVHHPMQGSSPRDMVRYFELRGLGRALAWPHDERPVLLIDEIDKAPRDLPNDLLHALDVGQYQVAELRQDGAPISLPGGFELRRTMGTAGLAPSRRPFVVITSNAEQQLPEPFLRRCVFFHIRFPTRAQLEKIVESRLEHEGADPPADGVVSDAVTAFVALRNVPELDKKPATSELLDWMQTLRCMWPAQPLAAWLRAFVERIDDRGRQDEHLVLKRDEHVHWAKLPGLECLLKRRNDLDRVAALG